MLALSPVAAAARLANRRGRVLLHSARAGDGLGAWSFVAAEPSATLMARGRSLVRLDEHGRPARRFTGDPFEAAEAFLAEHGCTLGPRRDEPPDVRVIGLFSYDLARVVEQLPGGPTLGHDVPDLWLGAYEAVARWRDGVDGVVVGHQRAWLEAALDKGARTAGLPPSFGPLVPDDDGGHHMARVDRVRDHLAAGDVSQVNLARRHVARVRAPGDALALYEALVEAAPARYRALIEADGVTVVSGSPERFLASAGDRIETRPVTAEVDHDGARGSARPRAGIGYASLLRATFPGDAITGAPKVRAMQLIDELEPARRGPYGGALGYFGTNGSFDLALAIRIGVLAGRELRVHVGGGIVADSDPAAALAETEHETKGWLAALERLARAPGPR